MSNLLPVTLLALWHERYAGVRLCLILFAFGWAASSLLGYPETPAYSVLNRVPETLVAYVAALTGLLMLSPVRGARLCGAALSLLLWLFVSVCLTSAIGVCTGTLTYLLLLLLSFDVLVKESKG